MGSLNRRTLFGAAAIGVPALAMPAAVAADNRDARLIALGEQDGRLYEQFVAASARTKAAYARYQARLPKPSPVLTITRSDAFRFGAALYGQVGRSLTQRDRDWLSTWLEQTHLRSGNHSLVEGRARDLIAAYDEDDRTERRVSVATGLRAASVAEGELYERLTEVEGQIVALPCHTMDGARVKARIARRYNQPDEDDQQDWGVKAAMQVVDLVLQKGAH